DGQARAGRGGAERASEGRHSPAQKHDGHRRHRSQRPRGSGGQAPGQRPNASSLWNARAAEKLHAEGRVPPPYRGGESPSDARRCGEPREGDSAGEAELAIGGRERLGRYFGGFIRQSNISKAQKPCWLYCFCPAKFALATEVARRSSAICRYRSSPVI